MTCIFITLVEEDSCRGKEQGARSRGQGAISEEFYFFCTFYDKKCKNYKIKCLPLHVVIKHLREKHGAKFRKDDRY